MKRTLLALSLVFASNLSFADEQSIAAARKQVAADRQQIQEDMQKLRADRQKLRADERLLKAEIHADRAAKKQAKHKGNKAGGNPGYPVPCGGGNCPPAPPPIPQPDNNPPKPPKPPKPCNPKWENCPTP